MLALFQGLSEFQRKAGISFVIRFGGLAIQFVASILVARALGAEGFGAFTYAFSWALLIGVLLGVGLGDLSVREIPSYLQNNNISELNGLLIVILCTLGVMGAIAAVVCFMLERTGVFDLAPGWLLVALVAALHGAVLALSNLLNAFQRMLTSQSIETLFRQVAYVSVVAVSIYFGFALSPSWLFTFHAAIGMTAILLMITVLTREYSRKITHPAAPVFHTVAWYRGAMPLLITSVANILLTEIDILIVGGVLGDYEVGLFRAASRGAMLVTLANIVVLQLLAPMISRALAERDHDGVQSLLRQAALVAFLMGLGLCVVLGLFAPQYLSLFGPEFTEVSDTLRILLVGQAIVILAGADAILLIMLRRDRTVLWVTVFAVLAKIVLNSLVVGTYGVNGIAVVSAIVFLCLHFVLLTVIFRTTDYDTTLMSLFRRSAGSTG